uniref:Uncharacterized protein n=1 Tax=Caenorhabditis japonica TaxID=281687 RepID=A0A8R1HN75_CAEJA
MTVMKEARPLQDLLLQLGSSNKLNVFQKAKQQNFTTFFSGPQQIRDLFEVDYDTTTHRNFVFQDLIDDKKCLEDGRRFVDDQLERFKGFLTATKGFKFFSTIFLDDYGVRKKAIDLDLNETLTNLESNGIFQNTTLIITSYNLSDKELTGADEDDKNPFLAVRLSDEWKKRYPQKFDFLNMNFNRLVLSSNTYELIMNLLEPNSTSSESPWFTALSIFRTCSDLGISKNTCLCMNTVEYCLRV